MVLHGVQNTAIHIAILHITKGSFGSSYFRTSIHFCLFWRWYDPSWSLTAGIIFMASDYCAQMIERGGGGEEDEDKTPLVWSRMLTNFLVGLLVFGPAANAWYSMVFKILPSTSLFSTLQKAALGQVIFGPAFTSVFFGAGMIQAGSFSVSAWVQKVSKDLPAVWASGLGFWPFVDFISYKVIPVQWIPLFVNFCSFVWTIYLSVVSNRSRGEEA